AGSSLAGSRITSCQFGALSHAYSSLSVTPCQVASCGRGSARGGRGSRADEIFARSSIGRERSPLFLLARRIEFERRPGHAVAPPGGLRPVGEHVPEMRFTRSAADLGAPHEP